MRNVRNGKSDRTADQKPPPPPPTTLSQGTIGSLSLECSIILRTKGPTEPSRPHHVLSVPTWFMRSSTFWALIKLPPVRERQSSSCTNRSHTSLALSAGMAEGCRTRSNSTRRLSSSLRCHIVSKQTYVPYHTVTA